MVDGSGSERRRHQPNPQAPADSSLPECVWRIVCSPPALADLALRLGNKVDVVDVVNVNAIVDCPLSIVGCYCTGCCLLFVIHQVLLIPVTCFFVSCQPNDQGIDAFQICLGSSFHQNNDKKYNE